jgi:hypothetical protein
MKDYYEREKLNLYSITYFKDGDTKSIDVRPTLYTTPDLALAGEAEPLLIEEGRKAGMNTGPMYLDWIQRVAQRKTLKNGGIYWSMLNHHWIITKHPMAIEFEYTISLTNDNGVGV